MGPVFDSWELLFGRGGLYGSLPSGGLSLAFGFVFCSRASLRFFHIARKIVTFLGNILMEGQETIEETQK